MISTSCDFKNDLGIFLILAALEKVFWMRSMEAKLGWIFYNPLKYINIRVCRFVINSTNSDKNNTEYQKNLTILI